MNRKNLKNILISLIPIFFICFLVFSLAWSPPTEPAPGGNPPAFLSVSSVTQFKEGALGVGGVFQTDNETHLAINAGNVGIGTTTPEAQLHIDGHVIADEPTEANHLATKAYVDSAGGEEEDCSTLPIGWPCGGGVVAYHDGSGGGLIVAVHDQSDSIQWGCRGTFVGTSDDYGAGENNTNAIIAFHEGWSSPWETGPNGETCNSGNDGTVAARVAREYDGGGYDDWFLPSKDELDKIVENTEFHGGIGAFDMSSVHYWSSSEDTSTNSWIQRFSVGNQFHNYQTNTTRVRAVRAF